jgi:hypothetical protein
VSSNGRPQPEPCCWTEPGTEWPPHEGPVLWVVIGCEHEHMAGGWSCRHHLDRAVVIMASDAPPTCDLCGGHACGRMIRVPETGELYVMAGAA